MKFIVAFVALVAVAAANPLARPTKPVAAEASPVVIGPLAPGTPAPLVQLIVNINKGTAGYSPMDVAPVIVGPALEPTVPVEIVDVMPVSPIEIVDVMPVSPVEIVDVMPVSPVEIVDVMPVSPVEIVDVMPISPVNIGTPVFPSPAVVLPEELN